MVEECIVIRTERWCWRDVLMCYDWRIEVILENVL